MVNLKRMLVVLSAVAITVAGWGVLTVGASNSTPSSTALVQTGQTAYLGVRIRDTNDAVIVWEVDPGSPADEAGIYIGDLIVAIDGQNVTSANDLVQAIQSHAPGDEVSLTLEWRGVTRDVSVTLAQAPTQPSAQAQPPANNNNGRTNRQPFTGMLNLMGLNATWQSDGTLLIDSIATDSPFAGTDLQAGDKIVAINGNKLDQGTDLMPRGLLDMFNFTSDQPVTFTIERDGQQMDVDVTLTMPMYGSENGTDTMPGYGFGGMMVAGQPTQLGVRFRTLTPQIAQDEGLSVEQGAQIVEVYADTPAANAGLQADDIIVSVDGDAVDQQHTLAERLAAYQEGDEVIFSVLRAGETIEVKVTLGPRATDQMPYGFFGPGMGSGGMNNMPDGHWFYYGPNSGQNNAPDNDQQAQPGNRGDAMLPLEQFLQMHPFLRDFMGQNGSGLDLQTIPVPEQVAPQPVVPDAQNNAA